MKVFEQIGKFIREVAEGFIAFIIILIVVVLIVLGMLFLVAVFPVIILVVAILVLVVIIFNKDKINVVIKESKDEDSDS